MKHKLSFQFILFCFFGMTILSCTAGKLTTSKSSKNAYTHSQKELILNASKEKPMRVFLTTNPSDSLLLRKSSMHVNPNPSDEVLTLFIDRLLSTVQDSMSMGVGIAAPQVGILKNIIWVQRFDKEDFPFEVYLNPKIVQYSVKKQDCPEGCLSIPNKRATTKNRSYAILLEYDKIDGSHHVEMVEDFTAVIFQHEIDHLHGILFTDHVDTSLITNEE